MIHLLSECGCVNDVARMKYGESPVTFGERIERDEGEVVPGEVVLTAQTDLLSEQSLDYIFHIANEDFEDTQDIDNLDMELLNVSQFNMKK